jgi:hypothetical protein
LCEAKGLIMCEARSTMCDEKGGPVSVGGMEFCASESNKATTQKKNAPIPKSGIRTFLVSYLTVYSENCELNSPEQ